MKQAPVIAVANHKGGVGKTSIAVRIAVAWAQAGKRVLVVDLDPQGAASMLVRGATLNEEEAGTHEVLLEKATLADAAQATEYGFELVGAGDFLAEAELELAGKWGREAKLKNAIREAPRDRWGAIILDCPPSLGVLLVNGLTASSHVIVPTMPALLSLAALRVFDGAVAMVRKNLNPKLKLLGYVLNQADARERALEETRELLARHAGEDRVLGEIRVDARLRGAGALMAKGRAGEDIERLAADLARSLELK